MTRDTSSSAPLMQAGSRSGGLIQVCCTITLLVSCASGFSGWENRGIAAEPNPASFPKETFSPDPELLDLDQLKPGNTPASAVTSTTISATRLTVPSLWWLRDQFAAERKYGSRLIENWIAYPNQVGRVGQVNFVVNRQLWNQLDYLQRYSFLHEFGMAAKSYGYNLRVFDNQANFLAAYTCNFDPSQMNQASGRPLTLPGKAPGNLSTPQFSSYIQSPEAIACYSFLDFGGKSSLGGRATQTGGGTSTNPGIAGP
ncbi:MAG: hypothetical protein WCA35_28650 [Kovacikia sp.]